MQGSLENVERVTNRAALGRVFVYTYVQTQYIDTIVDNLHDGFLYAIISTAAAKSAGDATDDIERNACHIESNLFQVLVRVIT